MSIVTVNPPSSLPFGNQQTQSNTRSEPHKLTNASEETALEVSSLGEVYAIFRAVAERVRNEQADNPTDNIA